LYFFGAKDSNTSSPKSMFYQDQFAIAASRTETSYVETDTQGGDIKNLFWRGSLLRRTWISAKSVYIAAKSGAMRCGFRVLRRYFASEIPGGWAPLCV